MCEFWSNHLNIATPNSEPWATEPSNDVEVMRRHALGRFEDMPAAGVVSPAMLHYLTNTESTKKAPNENLGREMVELHSVDAGRDRAPAAALRPADRGSRATAARTQRG
ncbi:MAG: hypothetical protein JWN35_941, partial [Frankiales bacterium]|nr:hypothetical protein [Frankiales bacterium]